MAMFNTRSDIEVLRLPENKRYTIHLRDWRSAITIGLEPNEALTTAKKIMLLVAETDHSAVIEAMSHLADQLTAVKPEEAP